MRNIPYELIHKIHFWLCESCWKIFVGPEPKIYSYDLREQLLTYARYSVQNNKIRLIFKLLRLRMFLSMHFFSVLLLTDRLRTSPMGFDCQQLEGCLFCTQESQN
jgi:hypothetical protein